MTSSYEIDGLNRLMKQLLDSRVASSAEEAEAIFRTYRLHVSIDEAEATDSDHQIALLTTVNLACRAFLGGVSVSGALEAPLVAPLPLGSTLKAAVQALGGAVEDATASTPVIYIGGAPRARESGFRVRAVFSGWRGGILAAHSPVQIDRVKPMPLSAVLAGALAVNEAFLYVQQAGSAIGKRKIGLSLWNPSTAHDWSVPDPEEPELRFLPSNLWLLGLGHLGQAYLWGLSTLPYGDERVLNLVLQDTDEVTKSSVSTSILSTESHIGSDKTRVLSAWCTDRGFRTRLIEREFDGTFRRQRSEPAIALCGFDNPEGRVAMETAGFIYIVEAGLGQGHQDFRTMQIHTLPSSRPFSEIWRPVASSHEVQPAPAYQKMIDDGILDQCGVTQLSGKAVGAPFVGCTAACLVLAEVLRQLHGGPVHDLISLDLTDVEHRHVVGHPNNFYSVNPGCLDLGAHASGLRV